MKENKLTIVTGASGALGSSYTESFSSKNYRSIAFTRSNIKDKHPKLENVIVDLLDEEKVREEVNNLNLDDIQEVILVHPVGRFKFQHENTIADEEVKNEMISSNVTTLENVLLPLLHRTNGTSTLVTVCAFGSISDRYSIPFWNAYSHSKNVLRALLEKLATSNNLVRVLFVNVSSVDTGNENILRPEADKRYWLKTEKIVDETVLLLESEFTGYKEIDVYNPRPDFDQNYFKEHKKILEKWLREMGTGN